MRPRVAHRLVAVAAAVAVAATTMAGLPASATYASPPRYLTADSFHEVALQGFGDPQNSWAWAMAAFNNRLYVGTNRNFDCLQLAAAARAIPWIPLYPPPPDTIHAVPCNPDPQALDEAGQIWALNLGSAAPYTQSDWTKVYQSPYNVTVNITRTTAITLAPRDIAFRDMSVFTEPDGTQALYVSGVGSRPLNGPNVPPPSLLRTTDGVNFAPVPADPGTTMGSINALPSDPHACCIRSQASLNGRFYLVIGTLVGSGAVFVSPDPKQGDNSFQQITPPDMKVFEIAAFNGHLYLGAESTHGYQIFQTDCAAPPPGQAYCPTSAFTQVVPSGGGLGSKGDGSVVSMHVYTDPNGVQHLYVGTDGIDDTSPSRPAEIVRINTDDSWDLVMGDPRLINGVRKAPLSGLTSGFGWYFNQHVWRMADYQGVLYASTYDSSTVWKNTSLWQSLQPMIGFDLWASLDGLTWLPVTQNGFGDPFSYGGRTLAATDQGLFVGSANPYYGLRIWQGALSSTALQAAPTNLQSDATGNQGEVALAWDAPSTATVFHVFRSQEKQVALPWTHPSDPTSAGASITWPHRIWVPSAYTEIGTSSTPHFVDTNARLDGHTSYYVVAQDARGNLSLPSNVTLATRTVPLPTLKLVIAAAKHIADRGHLTATQASAIQQSLQQIQAHLQSGDVQGARDLIEALRQNVLAGARGAQHKLYAEGLSFLLKRLEKRLDLVLAHIVTVAKVS